MLWSQVGLGNTKRMKNIFIGNLSYSTTEDMLRWLFEKHGAVDGVKIITDPESGQPRGFGFVAMTNDAEAVKAINALNGTDLEGRTLTVDEARPREDRPRTDRSGGGGGQMKRIYVGNLSSSVTEDALRALFEVYGAVEGVSIMTDRYTKQPRGFAFVAMTTDAEAVKAIASLNRRDLEGGRLSVKEARPKTDRPGGGGGGYERKRW